MSDPRRSDRHAAPADVPERDRDARVEELLLAGLDHYFAGQHELAINVWTRVLFLDRGHARARAYIERARGAIAEGQREGEELLHAVAAALQRGDASAARGLLESAVERGGRSEEASALLDRLHRLEAAAAKPVRSDFARPSATPAPGGAKRLERRSPTRWVAAGILLGLALAAGGLVLWPGMEAWVVPAGSAGAGQLADRDEPLPVPSPSEIWLDRAVELRARGRLHDALATLDGVRRDDALRVRADALRSEIQDELLAASRGGAHRGSAAGAPRPRAGGQP